VKNPGEEGVMKLAAFGFAVLLGAGSGFAASEDLNGAFQEFKQVQALNDSAKLKESAIATYALARKVAEATAPEDVDKDAFATTVANGKAVELYIEYALLAAAVQGPAATTVDLLSTLEQQNPKSKYLGENYGLYLEALRKTGATSKMQAVAEKGLSNFPENEDLLLWLADTAYSHKQAARSLGYSKRLIAVLNKRSKPESVSAADWERKRTAALGHAYFLAGSALSDQGQYQEADKNLRAALPLAKGNDVLRAQVLYLLGVANYQFGLMTNNKAMVVEAVKFSKQAAEIPGPTQQNAEHNAYVMEQQTYKMR
jgi:tetratricopeptide (TPR) repeat protein